MSLVLVKDIYLFQCNLHTCWFVDCCINIARGTIAKYFTVFEVLLLHITTNEFAGFHVAHSLLSNFIILKRHFDALTSQVTRKVD